MKLILFPLRNNTRIQKQTISRMMIPLVAALAFGCSNKGSIEGMSEAQIRNIHTKIAASEYRLRQAEIEIIEKTQLCTTDCDVLSPEQSKGFNSSRPIIAVYIKNDSEDSYLVYIYDKQTGRRIVEGIGDSQRRIFVVVDSDGIPIRLKRTKHTRNGWETEENGLVLNRSDALVAWNRAVNDFRSLVAMEKNR